MTKKRQASNNSLHSLLIRFTKIDKNKVFTNSKFTDEKINNRKVHQEGESRSR